MTDTQTPTDRHAQKATMEVSPLGAGIVGAIAGAALGAVAAVALSDQETRKKMQKNIKVLKDRAIKIMDTLDEAKEKPTLSEKVHTVDDALNEPTPTTTPKQ